MTLEPTTADFAPADAGLVEVTARFVVTREAGVSWRGY